MKRTTTTKRTRITLAEGCYQDATGVTVQARLGSGLDQLEKKERFGLIGDDGIPYSRKNNAELIKCRLQLMEVLKDERDRATSKTGTLGAAIDAWKAAHPLPEQKGASRKRDDDHDLITHWRAVPLADVLVDKLKRSQVRAQLLAWEETPYVGKHGRHRDGVAPSSLNHRKRMLGDLLRWHLGADDDNDVEIITDGIAHVKDRPAEARGIPMPILSRILATMPDRGRAGKGETRGTVSKTKIRLRVMAWTGLSHQSLAALERRRVNFRDGKMFYPDRSKGAGFGAVWVDMLPPAMDALRDYDEADLWRKTFSRSSMHKSWKRAVANTRKALVADAEKTGDKTMLEQFLLTVPPNCHPYDTRHSFLTDAYQQSGDLKAVADLGQHKSLKTTERYTKAAVPERVAKAVDAMRAKWFPKAPKPAATVRDFHIVNS